MQNISVTKSSVFWGITQCSPVKVSRRFGVTSRLTFTGIHVVLSQNTELFLTTADRTPNLINRAPQKKNRTRLKCSATFNRNEICTGIQILTKELSFQHDSSSFNLFQTFDQLLMQKNMGGWLKHYLLMHLFSLIQKYFLVQNSYMYFVHHPCY
jgi:hypothetical protein